MENRGSEVVEDEPLSAEPFVSNPLKIWRLKTALNEENFKPKAEWLARHKEVKEKQLSTWKGPRPATRQMAEQLFLLAKEAYKSAGDYKGVYVRPIGSNVRINEIRLPWCVQDKSIKDGTDRYIDWLYKLTVVDIVCADWHAKSKPSTST